MLETSASGEWARGGLHMERRKFVIGVGALASGTAAAVGTGAFSSVTAARNVDVRVASDANAYLRLEGAGGPNADYVEDDGTNGTLSIALDSTNPPTGGGQGVNPDAVTEIDYLFIVENQGTQEVDVDIDKFGNNAGLVEFWATNDDTQSDPYSSGERLDGSGNAVTLGTGDNVYVSIKVDTKGQNVGSGDELLDSVMVNAVET